MIKFILRQRDILLVAAAATIAFIFFFRSPAMPNPDSQESSGPAIAEPTGEKLGTIPEDATLIFWSTRDVGDAKILGPSNLYVMNQDGSKVTRITFESRQYQHAAVAPDRKHIVASCADGRNQTMWLLDLEKQTRRQLVPHLLEAGNGGVDWSVNNWLYFRARPRGGPREPGNGDEVYRVRPDGTQLTRLTTTPELAVYDVSVSEDGTLIAFVGMRKLVINAKTGIKTQIWVAAADGSAPRLVDDGGREVGWLGGFPLGDYDPEISPDNRYVVFSRTNTGVPPNFRKSLKAAHDLWIVPIDGSAPAKRITEPGPICIIPDWHDGKIVYTEYNERDSYAGLALINPDGTGRQRLERPAKLWDGGRHGKFILDAASRAGR